ncbi:MAG: hypothetical protein ACOCYB_08600 [Alkalispirochaeta sp.]
MSTRLQFSLKTDQEVEIIDIVKYLADMRFFTLIIIVSGLLLVLSSCDDLLGGDDTDGADTLSDPLPAKTEVTDSDGSAYEVGYDQVSGNDQDPFVRKTDASGNEVWRIRHDQTPVDARAVLITLDDEDRPYVVFTTDGGSNDSDRFQLNHVTDGAFSDAPFASYGAGGGAKVTVIARLDPDTGRIERGTFLVARKTSDNTANSMDPEGLEVSGDQVVLDVNSFAWPPGEGATQSNWNYYTTSGSTPLALRYTFPADLTEISGVASREE